MSAQCSVTFKADHEIEFTAGVGYRVSITRDEGDDRMLVRIADPVGNIQVGTVLASELASWLGVPGYPLPPHPEGEQ